MPLAVVPARDRLLQRLLERTSEERMAAGALLWTSGAPARSCVLVRSGLVLLRDGRGRGVDLAGPGELTGIEATSGARAYITSAVVLSEASVARVDGEAVLRALRRTRHTLPLLVRELLQETERARRAAAGAGGLSAAERLALVLLDLRDRFAGPEGWLPEGIPHRVLGELAGLHRSTVTTELNAWIYEGVLRQRGRRIRIAKPAALPGRTFGEGAEASR